MGDYIVLAHAGEEALPVLLPIMVIGIFLAIKSSRAHDGPDDDEPSE